ncbi:MAG: hypothetical protein ACOCU7_03950 [Tangfeifania sp.]
MKNKQFLKILNILTIGISFLVLQRFHALALKKIEVSDLNSSLVMYDTQTNEMMDVSVSNTGGFMDTYPEWSPDGNSLDFTMHDYGCFPIWHKEADLYNLNL